MSPSVHRADKDKLHIRWEREYRVLVEKLMARGGDKDKTALMKRLVKEAAKREGVN